MRAMSEASSAGPRASEEGYLIPSSEHRTEETISRSRFVTTLAPAPTAEDAHAFIDAKRAEFADATHNCWAFVAGPPGSSSNVGMSDDGEPHGTAGRPMLHALSHSDVGEIVAVCTRYYGGTKLGTGGLARAYRGGVILALDTLPTRRKVEREMLAVTVPYSCVDAFERLQERFDFTIGERTYDTEAHYRVQIAAAQRERAERAIQDIARGEARVFKPTGVE